MEILVKKDSWDALSNVDKEAIHKALREAGAIGDRDNIIGDPHTDLASVQNLVAADGPCQAACTAAYGRATRVCSLLPHPAARAVCYGAATAAYAVCLRNC
jgi:hypothetical protein